MIWCQGFSEPDSGSDLASLQTSARRDGDEWCISGQKIWTSYATMAQWCFLLARTSRGERKQQGLTIFLVPMSDPAVEVRPIDCMMGPHHLNEVFFDEVRVPDAAVLGTVDEGWKVVQEVLAFERVGIARYARCERLLKWAPVALGDPWAALPERARGRWVRASRTAVGPDFSPIAWWRCRAGGKVEPRRRRGLPHRGDHPRSGDRSGARRHRGLASISGAEAEQFRRAVADHSHYSVSATVASGSIEMQRILMARSLLATS